MSTLGGTSLANTIPSSDNFGGSSPGDKTTISIGPIDYTDNLAKYQPSPTGGYTDYFTNNRYYRDNMIVMAPIASPNGFQGNSVAFGQLAAPTIIWFCDWTAAKTGSQPQTPDPVVNDPDWEYLYAVPETAVPVIYPDGVTPLYRISGTYVYGNRKPKTNVMDNVNYPRRPDIQDTFPRGIQPSTLQQGLSNLGSSNAQSASPGAPGVSLQQSSAPAGVQF